MHPDEGCEACGHPNLMSEQAWEEVLENPLNVNRAYPRHRQLQADLTRYYESCKKSKSASSRFGGQRIKQYCAGVAWKRVHLAGRHKGYARYKGKKAKPGKVIPFPRRRTPMRRAAEMVLANPIHDYEFEENPFKAQQGLLVVGGVAAVAAVVGSIYMAKQAKAAPASPSTPSPAAYNLGTANSGGALKVNVGDTINIKLPFIPGQGVAWQPNVGFGDIVAIESSNYTDNNTTITYSLRAKSAGSVGITFTVVDMSGVPTQPPTQFTQTVNVAGSSAAVAGVGQLMSSSQAASIGTGALLANVASLFAGGAAGAYVGGHEHRIAGVVIGAIAGGIIAGTATTIWITQKAAAAAQTQTKP